jgi:hypothetical protein
MLVLILTLSKTPIPRPFALVKDTDASLDRVVMKFEGEAGLGHGMGQRSKRDRRQSCCGVEVYWSLDEAHTRNPMRRDNLEGRIRREIDGMSTV